MRSSFRPRPSIFTKCAWTVPWNSNLKLYARYGSCGTPGWAVMSGSCRLDRRQVGGLAQLEDRKLRRFHRRDPDQRHHPSLVPDLGRVGLGVALDEERLLRGLPDQGAVAPDVGEERAAVAPQRRPQRVVVGLEDRP